MPDDHYTDVIMGAVASQITSLTIVVYSTVYSDADQRKHQSSASLAFVWGIHRWPVNWPHKWPVTREMFPFDDVIVFDDQFKHLGEQWVQKPWVSLDIMVISTPTAPPHWGTQNKDNKTLPYRSIKIYDDVSFINSRNYLLFNSTITSSPNDW